MNFLGWYQSLDDGETCDWKWSFGTMTVEKDLTLYAKWRIHSYHVTFETKGEVFLRPVTLDYGRAFQTMFRSRKAIFFSVGPWIRAPHRFMTHVPAVDVRLHANWALGVSMAEVGESGKRYRRFFDVRYENHLWPVA